MQVWQKRGNATTILEAILARAEASEGELLAPCPVPPEAIDGIPAAADLIVRCALQGDMPVVIVGDYDADGVTATAILVKLLHHFGVSPRAIIPRRFTNGYGITHSLVEGISHSLLITVDNGIAAVEPIQAAKAAGNVVLILDHHLPQAEIPPADVIVDPHLHPERNGYEHYCGAGLAYKLAEYLCREASSQEKKDLFFDLLVLACLGTLADVMPLTGDNRRLVMSGLTVINRDSWYQQISPGLKSVLDLSPRPYTEDTIKFQTAPILNATGRLFDAGSASVLKALITTEPTAAAGYAAKMKAINQRRKDLVAQWLAAVEEAAAGQEEAPILLVRCQGIPEGIVGIVAGKLSEAHQRPAFVFSDIASAPGLLRGSGRTYGDFDLSPLIPVVTPFAESAGGHAGAAGITVSEGQYGPMGQAITQWAQDNRPPAADDTLYYDLDVTEADLPAVLSVLKAHAPYGPGAEKPVLALRGLRLQTRGGQCYRLMGKGHEHLKLFGQVSDAVGFDLTAAYLDLGCPGTVDLLGVVEENQFLGKTSLQFQFHAIRPCVEATQPLLPEEPLLAQV